MLINKRREGLLLEEKNSAQSIQKVEHHKLAHINIVGFILSVMAGWINAVGVKLFLNESSAFMSGRGLTLGYLALKGDLKSFISIILVIVSFIMGAYISTIITRKKGLSGGLFFVGFLIALSAFPISLRSIVVDTIIISMAMGAQNSATSLTAINRTTHLTGPATDIGIHMAKGNWDIVLFWSLRWISFPIGATIGFVLVDMFNNNIIQLSTTLLLPASIILSVAFIQKRFLKIPLLEKIHTTPQTQAS